MQDDNPMYEVVVINKPCVKGVYPRLPHSKYFKKDETFRMWLLQKLINSERSALGSTGFIDQQTAARRGLLNNIIMTAGKRKSC